MSTPYGYSQRGTFANGPAIAVQEFTDGSGSGRVMPQVSISMATGTGDYSELEQSLQGSVVCLPTVLIDSDGVPVSFYNKPSDQYGISDIDNTGATYHYFGFERADEAWYISRLQLSNNAYRYETGSSGYSTAWTNRVAGTYVTYGNAF